MADSSRGTIEYSIANPTTFIVCYIGDSDWQYNAASDVGDKNRWTTSKKAKSICDPCPVGWRVPDGGSKGVWAKALGFFCLFFLIHFVLLKKVPVH